MTEKVFGFENKSLPVNLVVNHNASKNKNLICINENRLQGRDLDLKTFGLIGFRGRGGQHGFLGILCVGALGQLGLRYHRSGGHLVSGIRQAAFSSWFFFFRLQAQSGFGCFLLCNI